MMLGTILIAAGIIIFGNIYGYWHLNLFFAGWWTLFIIIPGLVGMVQGGLNFGNALMVLVGAMLLLGQQGIINHDQVFQLLFPLILIMLGVFIFIGSHNSKKTFPGRSGGTEQNNNEDTPNYIAAFSSNEIKNISSCLQGGSATAIMGSIILDLRSTVISSNITFNTTAMMGSVEVLVPPGVRLRVTGLPMFGSNKITKISPTDESLPLITFNCLSLFGSTEIK